MTAQEIHAPGAHEHSLCGLAPEAFETGDHYEPVVFAGSGQMVSCSSCRLQIDWVKKNFRGYRYKESNLC